MYQKFFLVALFSFFAVFGSIETTWTNQRGDWSGYNGTSSFEGRTNSTWPYRPFGTVPPPRGYGNHSTQNPWIRPTTHRPICTDSWDINSPCRQFGTVPPPRHPGTGWNQGNSHPGQGYNSSHYPGRNGTEHYSSSFSNGRNNESTRPFNRSTSLYPSLANL